MIALSDLKPRAVPLGQNTDERVWVAGTTNQLC